MGLGDRLEALQAAYRAFDRGTGKAALAQRLVAQTDDFFLPRDNGERTAVGRVSDREFDGVGADVYRREFQCPETLGKFCYSHVNCN
jgi:hypothetical protein